MMAKRPRLIHNSQQQCVDAWLQQALPHHIGTVPAEGWARGWWRQRTLHFSGIHLYSIEAQEVEIARLALTPKNQWVVLVLKKHRETPERWHRTGGARWRADQAKIPMTNVTSFEQHDTNQQWYAERVAYQYGKWKRAHKNGNKYWRFQQLVRVVQERETFEKLLGLKRTKEEPDVRHARIVQRLSAS